MSDNKEKNIQRCAANVDGSQDVGAEQDRFHEDCSNLENEPSPESLGEETQA